MITQDKPKQQKRKRFLMLASVVMIAIAFTLGVLNAPPAPAVASDKAVSTVPTLPTLPPLPSCDNPTIESVQSGAWGDPTTWSEGRVPNRDDTMFIFATHTINDIGRVKVSGLCNRGIMNSPSGGRMKVLASEFIDNAGSILGMPGVSTSACGRGSNVILKSAEIQNTGTIRGGDGNSGDSCGGRGGHVYIYPYRSRDGAQIENTGDIRGGDGGDLTGLYRSRAGRGGNVRIFGGWRGTVINSGITHGGDGGNGNPSAVQPQHGGRGGCVGIWAGAVYLGGVDLRGGRGGSGEAGGRDGRHGCIRIDPPNEVVITGEDTKIDGADIEIYGGEGWDLKLNGLAEGAIVSSETILLSVGDGGSIDLSVNENRAIQAAEEVTLATDSLIVSVGQTVDDVVDAAEIVSEPSKINIGPELSGPGQQSGPGQTLLPLEINVANGSTVSDTFSLVMNSSLPWTSTSLPDTLELGPLEDMDLTFTVTLPAALSDAQVNVLTVSAVSQTDNEQSAEITIDITIDADAAEPARRLYLPMINK